MSKPGQEDLIVDALDALEYHEKEFNAWEQEFIIDMETNFEKYGSLTEKQESKLRQILRKVV